MHIPSLKSLPFFLISITLLQTALADKHGRRPFITPAVLLAPKRQAEQCADPTDTLCPDGLGCCPVGEACTYQSVTIPICAGSCGYPPVYCEGDYSNVCCDPGSSCDYASDGLCTANAFQFSSFSAAPTIAVPSLTAPSIIVPSLTVSNPSFPSFTPFGPATTTETAVDTVTEEGTSTEASFSRFTPSSVTTTETATTASVLQQSTGGAPGGKMLGNGLLEVVVGGIGLLVGL